MSVEIAVLSYHGWEIEPELVVRDVRALREQGWRDLTLEELYAVLSRGTPRSGRFFHVTSDDGAERDQDFVAALRSVGCPATLFVSLDVMSELSKEIHQEFLAASDVRVEDHSLRHGRTFHYRHVIGFHFDAKPFMGSPERMGLTLGSPVCIYGPELARPRFIVDEAAVEVCKNAARLADDLPGSIAWEAAITQRLLASRLGFRRLGKLCVQGEYESRDVYEHRISRYLAEGRRRLEEFINKPPVAFAYPWWQASSFSEKCLRDVGYRMTFSGVGLCQRQSKFGIRRLFINNDTPRPLDPKLLAASSGGLTGHKRWQTWVHRLVYA